MIQGDNTAARPTGQRSPAAMHGRDDAILSDLREFARDLGLGGAAAMSKHEIVEALRQHYLLRTLLGQHGGPSGLTA